MLAAFLPRWREAGYEVIVTADHGQTDRGHHGGHDDEMQDFALYYFGQGKGPEADTLLDQLQLAPTVLARLGVPVPRDNEGQAVPRLSARLPFSPCGRRWIVAKRQDGCGVLEETRRENIEGFEALISSV